jgi:PhnB protein
MLVQPYLMFNGRCEEALAFYKQALGAEVKLILRFAESPDPVPPGMIPPGSEQKVMHSEFRVGDSVLMATDGDCSGKTDFQGITLSIALPDAAAADRVWNALVEGGTVRMPIGKTFWSPRFGMLTDRFGVAWMINTSP